MAVSAGCPLERRQPLHAGLLHHHVQRLGMVWIPLFLPNVS